MESFVDELLEESYQQKIKALRENNNFSGAIFSEVPNTGEPQPDGGKNKLYGHKSAGKTNYDLSKKHNYEEPAGQSRDNMVDKKSMVKLSTEERDARTVLLMQMPRHVDSQTISSFFVEAGRVRDVRMIYDRNTGKSKGICYVEFENIQCVNQALKMSGRRMEGHPVLIQPTMSEKNRLALQNAAPKPKPVSNRGPMRLAFSNLDVNITEQMIRAVFEPFGGILKLKLNYSLRGESRGNGVVVFNDQESAREALIKLEGFEIAGRPMKLSVISGSTQNDSSAINSMIDLEKVNKLDLDEVGNSNNNNRRKRKITVNKDATRCLALMNVLDEVKLKGDKKQLDRYLNEIEHDFEYKAKEFGRVKHIYASKTRRCVYIKMGDTESASALFDELAGVKYDERTIAAEFVTEREYKNLFPNY